MRGIVLAAVVIGIVLFIRRRRQRIRLARRRLGRWQRAGEDQFGGGFDNKTGRMADDQANPFEERTSFDEFAIPHKNGIFGHSSGHSSGDSDGDSGDGGDD